MLHWAPVQTGGVPVFKFTVQYRCNNCHATLEPRKVTCDRPLPPLMHEHDCGDVTGIAIASWYIQEPSEDEKSADGPRIDGLTVVLVIWLLLAIIAGIAL